MMTDTSGPLKLEIPDNSMNQQGFGIRSTNVLLDSHDEPVEAIILIQDQKIHDVILPAQKSSAFLAQLSKDWSIQDYGDLVILPGLIDTNVHLHADYDQPDWENIQYSTELAAAGGVTTIIDNPVMSAQFHSGEEYVENFKKRIEKIRQKSVVDFGVFGVLEPRTRDNIKQILATGALGFKTFLSSCVQNTINYFEREDFEGLIEELEENHPELLLMIHPEMATDREMYLTSPCRIGNLKSRLDLFHEIKSIEFGGGANKGSYIDDFSKKFILDDGEDDEVKEDEEEEENETQQIRKRCSAFAEIDSPTKLESKIQETKEKNELNDLVHHELRSYNFEEEGGKDNFVVDEEAEVDSDNEFLEKMNQGDDDCEGEEEDKKDVIIQAPSQRKSSIKLKTISDSDNEEEKDVEKEKEKEKTPIIIRKLSDVGKRRSDGKLGVSPLKKSLFATLNSREPKDFTDAANLVEEKRTLGEEEEEDKTIGSIEILTDKPPAAFPKLSDIKEELESVSKEKKTFDFEAAKATVTGTTIDTLSLNEKPEKSVTVTSMQEEDLDNHPLRNKRLTSLGKRVAPLLTSWSEPDRCVQPEPEDDLNSTQRRPTLILENGSMTPLADDSPKSVRMTGLMSPLKAGGGGGGVGGTPSSLLLRRGLTFKSINQVRTPNESAATTPLGSLSRYSSLEVVKTPESNAGGNGGKEAKFNQSYRTFLANRPPSWEENAVSMVLDNLKSDTRLKVVLHNLSLATSFQKIKNKKNNGVENYRERIFGDASPAYLFFSEKMVKAGETKYKVSPPFRNQENKRFLLEHFRFEAIDMISSYHFFVPKEYKQIDQGNFRRSFGGLNAIGFSLQTVWSSMYSYQEKSNPRFKEDVEFRKKTINMILKQISKTMCETPSQLLKISDRKGMIAKGRDADFVIWDPFKAERKKKGLPEEHVFAGRKLMGRICKTFLRGSAIYDKDNKEIRKPGHSAVEFIKAL